MTVSTSIEKDQALFSVTDTGVGISAPDQEHVFDRFFRADKARSREAGGSGLGLAICKSIVEAHGGKISLTSEPGNGSTFTVALPIALNDAPCEVPETAQRAATVMAPREKRRRGDEKMET